MRPSTSTLSIHVTCPTYVGYFIFLVFLPSQTSYSHNFTSELPVFEFPDFEIRNPNLHLIVIFIFCFTWIISSILPVPRDFHIVAENLHDTASTQYDFGKCFLFIIALATSSICRFFRSTTPFFWGVWRQVNSHRIPSCWRYVVKASEKYTLPPSDRRHHTCRLVAFSTSFLNFWKCENTSLFYCMGNI